MTKVHVINRLPQVKLFFITTHQVLKYHMTVLTVHTQSIWVHLCARRVEIPLQGIVGIILYYLHPKLREDDEGRISKEPFGLTFSVASLRSSQVESYPLKKTRLQDLSVEGFLSTSRNAT